MNADKSALGEKPVVFSNQVSLGREAEGFDFSVKILCYFFPARVVNVRGGVLYLTEEQALDLACLTYDELLKPWDESGKAEIPEWFIDKASEKDCECLHIADYSGGIYMRLREQDLDGFDRCVFADRRTNPLTVTASWFSYADARRDYETYSADLFDDWASFHIYGYEPD